MKIIVIQSVVLGILVSSLVGVSGCHVFSGGKRAKTKTSVAASRQINDDLSNEMANLRRGSQSQFASDEPPRNEKKVDDTHFFMSEQGKEISRRLDN